MTSPATDARRIVLEVLTEHARGPDPVLAAHAQAELDERRAAQVRAVLDSWRAVGGTLGRAAHDYLEVCRGAARMAAALTEGFASTFAVADEIPELPPTLTPRADVDQVPPVKQPERGSTRRRHRPTTPESTLVRGGPPPRTGPTLTHGMTIDELLADSPTAGRRVQPPPRPQEPSHRPPTDDRGRP